MTSKMPLANVPWGNILDLLLGRIGGKSLWV